MGRHVIIFPLKEVRMKTNMGGLDRILRLVLAIVVAVLFFTKQITGTAAIVLGVIAVIFVLTSLVGFCPLYVPLGISTKKKARS
jgi:uncharacterized membrane protein